MTPVSLHDLKVEGNFNQFYYSYRLTLTVIQQLKCYNMLLFSMQGK